MADFVVTEAFGGPGEEGERRVFEAVKAAYAGEDVLGFWRYPLVTRETVREPDILIADPELGLVVIEVKSLPLDMIAGVSGYRWDLARPYYGKTHLNPYEQARKQAQLLGELAVRRGDLAQLATRALVALPLITREAWDGRFGHLLSDVPMLFADELTPARLRAALERTPPVRYGQPLDDAAWAALRSALGTSGNVPKRVIRPPAPAATPAPVRRADLVTRSARHLHAFDLQQELIAKTIPPGPQRIRGIAGSGKTVLLAQKAATMHLRHPDWNVALVFFSRSLYDQIRAQVDHWLRQASGGEQSLQTAGHRLRILHAWGSKDQPGFYRTLASQVGVTPLTVDRTPPGSPTSKLLFACRALLLDAQLTQRSLQVFDAVLIDEGQDLVHEEAALNFEEKQAFYWMAYQSLRPVARDALLDTGEPEARRLIWAYDEAQSLDTLTIPNTRELFGDQGAAIFGPGVSYRGGIRKSEVMNRCYRTPGPVLLAAHALGMGLLREGGMLAGLTNRADWQSIGYDVEGQFRSGSEVTLTRSPENSPNPLPGFTDEPLVTFETYPTRRAELLALIDRVQADLGPHGLRPSRQVLIVVPGLDWEPYTLQEDVFKALRSVNVSVYLPGNKDVNVPRQKWPDTDSNGFWRDGAVTVSPVMQAKGNEADVVYVVGVDRVAAREDVIRLRNQLFVGISRSRGWVHLSGCGMDGTPLADEIRRVLESGPELRFTYRQPRRQLDDVRN
ncbi:nuclease-related domain-containing DEAD/DEAH box helicase [Deinococcus sp. LM3]|uniref:NERD domain-containing protein n=1 Tax=Deinococcus sp. LM3 TaxID=1938608 RepID=UPI0009923597|nr:nuclease-related domain-containing DEAD/DEAH box helicase [Deinococcus sp. LM3]OOV11986.1 NERD domain protein [Deinococcus sp. LM3]